MAHRASADSISRDTLCLHLAWYLASWGMLRNSFLMQKDYRIHTAATDVIFAHEWDELWEISAEQMSHERYAKKIIELGRKISQAYIDSGSGSWPTDTLLTKILLGTVACTPAYDRYFKLAVSKTHAASHMFSAKSLMQLGVLYANHKDEFNALYEHCMNGGTTYPPAKLIDMCFFEYGLTIE